MDDVFYFSNIRWLSKATTLATIWRLREEIKQFMESKDKTCMDDETWLNDLTLLVDITRHLSDFNLKLQGKDQLVHKLLEHIQAFTQKLTLFKGHFSHKKFVHFPTLGTRPDASVDY